MNEKNAKNFCIFLKTHGAGGGERGVKMSLLRLTSDKVKTLKTNHVCNKVIRSF